MAGGARGSEACVGRVFRLVLILVFAGVFEFVKKKSIYHMHKGRLLCATSSSRASALPFSRIQPPLYRHPGGTGVCGT